MIIEQTFSYLVGGTRFVDITLSDGTVLKRLEAAPICDRYGVERVSLITGYEWVESDS